VLVLLNVMPQFRRRHLSVSLLALFLSVGQGSIAADEFPEARITRGAGETTELVQTEEAGYKLDGLILVIEGIGRTKWHGCCASSLRRDLLRR
jgi:hypothetical protein